ncbi:uncharacterized protein LOC115797580 [Archocentrus centrarchus]|uniref:uncharacterized protein LOC115797580 n=1 Tax=Archocentrus centrarchus TaxID=63155 RepID=UPI0011E9F1B9|nr:uncharacterized protein LOC115797580 [Archocentrus centrarchus]
MRALCTGLLMTIIILLDGEDQKVDAVSLSIAPNRSQFFEYESVTFYCEGVVNCDVVHKFKGKLQSCSKTAAGSSCDIKNVYAGDSGEYWSETEGGKKSNIINISVTDGSVILEVPALPVFMEESMTLPCRKKIASSNLSADFYKDGRHIHRSSTGNMNIYRVSKSDEGLYKCSISGAGESPESWLKVTDRSEEIRSSSAATAGIVVTVLFIVLLMAALGLYHFGKDYWNRAALAALRCLSRNAEGSGSAEDQTVSTETSTVNAGRATYAVVRKNRDKKEDEDGFCCRPSYFSPGLRDTQQRGTMPFAAVYQSVAEDPLYSTIE